METKTIDPYIYTTNLSSITVYLSGVPYSAQRSHPNYSTICKLIEAGKTTPEQEAALVQLFDTKQAVRAYLGNTIQISDSGVLTYNGDVIENVLTEKILQMLDAQFDIEPMLNFLINLGQNPSQSSREELMLFMTVNDMPITPDGFLLAYKSVNSDFKDIHSGTFDNSIGAICEMPRAKVDDNRSKTCSAGLHFAAKEYAAGFGSGHLMIIKINPADVVSIPNDYNNQKGRCCRYEVIDEVARSKDGKDKYNTKIVTDYHKTPECPHCGLELCEVELEQKVCASCDGVLP